jgi:hypothetical protein
MAHKGEQHVDGEATLDSGLPGGKSLVVQMVAPTSILNDKIIPKIKFKKK